MRPAGGGAGGAARRRATGWRRRASPASTRPIPTPSSDDARFALDALPALTTRPDQIKQLRQTILNLAVRGKLVPQDPNDEPASELLKRIATGKTCGCDAGATELSHTRTRADPASATSRSICRRMVGQLGLACARLFKVIT